MQSHNPLQMYCALFYPYEPPLHLFSSYNALQQGQEKNVYILSGLTLTPLFYTALLFPALTDFT